jgi:hypothetical protein
MKRRVRLAAALFGSALLGNVATTLASPSAQCSTHLQQHQITITYQGFFQQGDAPGTPAEGCSVIGKAIVQGAYRDGLLTIYPQTSFKYDGLACRSRSVVARGNITGEQFVCSSLGRPRFSMRFVIPNAVAPYQDCGAHSWQEQATGTVSGNSALLVLSASGALNPGEPCNDLYSVAQAIYSIDGVPAPPTTWSPWQPSVVGPTSYTLHFNPSTFASTGELPGGRYECSETFAAVTSLGALQSDGLVDTQNVTVSFRDGYVCGIVKRHAGSILRVERMGWLTRTQQTGFLSWIVTANGQLAQFGPPEWANCAAADWCPGPPAI